MFIKSLDFLGFFFFFENNLVCLMYNIICF